MTEEIFRRDGYAFEFEAVVVVSNGEDVELDITAFYPGGGGQVCDTGTIRGSRVTEVLYIGKKIIHKVPGNDLKVKDVVWCSVDWDRRYDLMMGHTGEHLLFCSLKQYIPDLAITKIFISPESKYVVIDRDIEWDVVGKAVRFANDAICDNLPVTKSQMSRDDPELENVRIKMERIPEGEEISIVSIGDIDLSACSGLHVMETGELEMMLVDRKVSAGKDGTAIHFKVGREAMNSAASLANICLMASEVADSKPEDIVRAISNLKINAGVTDRSVSDHVRRFVDTLIPRTINGAEMYSAILPRTERSVLTEIAESFKNKGAVSIFISEGENLSVVMSSGIPSVDCSKTISDVLKGLGGKGGGKRDFAQGGVSSDISSETLLEKLVAGMSFSS